MFKIPVSPIINTEVLKYVDDYMQSLTLYLQHMIFFTVFLQLHIHAVVIIVHLKKKS